MWRRATFTHPSIGAYNDSCPPDRCPHAHQVFDSGGKLLTTILWPCHTHFDVLHNAPNSNAFIITRIGRHTPHFYSIHTAQYSQLTSDDPTSSERVASVYSIYADIRPSSINFSASSKLLFPSRRSSTNEKFCQRRQRVERIASDQRTRFRTTSTHPSASKTNLMRRR